MELIVFLLLIAALVCFLLSAFGGSDRYGRVHYVALGLAFWVITVLLDHVPG